MTDWRNALRDAAQRDEQEQLSIDDARAMRRVVVAAVAPDTQKAASSSWMRRPVLVAATIVAIISVGVGAGLRFDLGSRSQEASTTVVADRAPIAADAPTGDAQNRQLQFMTAGGTRIIWVFNQDFNLKATVR